MTNGQWRGVIEEYRSLLDIPDGWATAAMVPIGYPVGRGQSLLSAMRKDKKTRGSMLRFVVIDDVAKPRILEGPDEGLLFMAYQSLAD